MKLLNHGYETSKDYQLLFELMKRNRIICFIPFDEEFEDGYILKDVCQTKATDEGYFDVSARGYSYITAFNREDFIKKCESAKLEFVNPIFLT